MPAQFQNTLSDEQPRAVEVVGGLVPAPADSGSGLTSDGRRMVEAIDGLPADEVRDGVRHIRVPGADTPASGLLQKGRTCSSRAASSAGWSGEPRRRQAWSSRR